MITTMQMYWLVTLDSILTMCGLIAAITAIATFITIGMMMDEALSPRVPAICGAICLFFLIASTFIPTTKQMATIIIIPRIANSEKVQTVGNRLYDLAVEWMDELRPVKEETK